MGFVRIGIKRGNCLTLNTHRGESMRCFQNIAKLIRQKRLTHPKGYSQSELSHLLGYKNGQFISNVERALCNIPLKMLKRKLNQADLIQTYIRYSRYLHTSVGQLSRFLAERTRYVSKVNSPDKVHSPSLSKNHYLKVQKLSYTDTFIHSFRQRFHHQVITGQNIK